MLVMLIVIEVVPEITFKAELKSPEVVRVVPDIETVKNDAEFELTNPVASVLVASFKPNLLSNENLTLALAGRLFDRTILNV